MIEVKGCDIKRVGIVAVEKRGKTRRNFSEVTNVFKNCTWFVVNVIFQLAGYCFRRKVLLFPKGLGDDSMGISSSNGWLNKWKKGTASVK